MARIRTHQQVAGWLGKSSSSRPRPPDIWAVTQENLRDFIDDFCDEVTAAVSISPKAGKRPEKLEVECHLLVGLKNAFEWFLSGDASSLDAAFGLARTTGGRRSIAETDESRDSRLVVAFLELRLQGKTVTIAADGAGETVKPAVSGASVKKAWGNPRAREMGVAVWLLGRRRTRKRISDRDLITLQKIFGRLPDPKNWDRRAHGSYHAQWISKSVADMHAFLDRRNN